MQTWNGSAWVTQATVTGNAQIVRHIVLPTPVTTTKLKLIVGDDASNGLTSNDGLVTLTEVEAWTPTGADLATQRFDAFGGRLAGTGTIPTFGYTGREPDATGLVYYRARYYDPGLGRFTSRDPLGYRDGLNRYAYVGNNPVNFNSRSRNSAGLRACIDGAYEKFESGKPQAFRPTAENALKSTGLDKSQLPSR